MKNKKTQINFLVIGLKFRTKDIIGFLNSITATSSTEAFAEWTEFLQAWRNSWVAERHSNAEAIIKKCKKSTRHLCEYLRLWGKLIMSPKMINYWGKTLNKQIFKFQNLYWLKTTSTKIVTTIRIFPGSPWARRKNTTYSVLLWKRRDYLPKKSSLKLNNNPHCLWGQMKWSTNRFHSKSKVVRIIFLMPFPKTKPKRTIFLTTSMKIILTSGNYFENCWYQPWEVWLNFNGHQFLSMSKSIFNFFSK